jgi:hypothetical protein
MEQETRGKGCVSNASRRKACDGLTTKAERLIAQKSRDGAELLTPTKRTGRRVRASQTPFGMTRLEGLRRWGRAVVDT